MNFVIELFENNEHNAILMIMNKFLKMHHYISCHVEKNETNAEKIAKLFVRNVWKLHDLFTIIISNRNSQFVSFTWNTLCKILNIKIKFSIVFHSKIDDQNEISNQKMKRYLRTYVNYQQNDWFDWFSMIEYVSNVFVFASIKLFSFFVNYDFESRMNFESMKIKNTTRKRIFDQKTKNIHINMKKIWFFAKDHLI